MCSLLSRGCFSLIAEVDVAPCIQRPVDLVFLLDGTERLGPDKFQEVLTFVKMVGERVGLARDGNDRKRLRMALVQYGTVDQLQVAFQLTHDPDVIAEGIARLAYLDSSSVVGPAIISTIDRIVGRGPGRGSRRFAEISFVFITDGFTGKNQLQEAVDAMRTAQVVSTVLAPTADVDQEVLNKLVLGDKSAVFKNMHFSSLLHPHSFERFIRWVC